ncbi:hypothetical protein Phum_PHUM604800 [Pediculus humanus corporis]|uniref:Uncharacterized protein n=1 Tax=Pediculus humanus subsp. corporis TaxID=121224 RepID=E0W3I1_PEDHC|nr:uncharacterized protein Phum_PHUM604800 [Pediculus humanus corporis]EEB20187.1 hypothetical protein Phum_PHUM604800 [Pediculus humanus corporis]
MELTTIKYGEDVSKSNNNNNDVAKDAAATTTISQKKKLIIPTSTELKIFTTPTPGRRRHEEEVEETTAVKTKVTSPPIPIPPLLPKSVIRVQSSYPNYYAEAGVTPSTEISPSWYQNRKWSFEAPASFISWSKNRISNNPLSTAVGGLCAVAVIIIMIIVLIKSLPGRRRYVEKKSNSETKEEDKTRLLKPSARTSDEE